MKKIIFCLMLWMLTACAGKNPLTDYRFQTQTVPPYVVASWFKINAPGDTLRVYIEGDGAAFTVKGRPTDNPTPTDTFMRRLAAEDPNPNVAYLGRPCQYLQTGACSETDWTDGRFSEKIVSSMERAVLNLMKKARTKQVVLIGYSGGAQIAGLIAVRHPQDTVMVITISGVLDHRAWTQFHQDAPLSHSLNLADERAAFAKIAQHHFAGAKDEVVPPDMITDFAGKDLVTVVPKARHNKGFEKIAPEIYTLGK